MVKVEIPHVQMVYIEKLNYEYTVLTNLTENLLMRSSADSENVKKLIEMTSVKLNEFELAKSKVMKAYMPDREKTYDCVFDFESSVITYTERF